MEGRDLRPRRAGVFHHDVGGRGAASAAADVVVIKVEVEVVVVVVVWFGGEVSLSLMAGRAASLVPWEEEAAGLKRGGRGRLFTGRRGV